MKMAVQLLYLRRAASVENLGLNVEHLVPNVLKDLVEEEHRRDRSLLARHLLWRRGRSQVVGRESGVAVGVRSSARPGRTSSLEAAVSLSVSRRGDVGAAVAATGDRRSEREEKPKKG